MFFEIAAVILPVFLLVLFGFFACSVQLLEKWFVDNLAKLCQDFGIPFLLFFNLAILDLNNAFDFHILICFYISMVISFLAITCISYFIFRQPYINSIILGFCAMFSNGVLLGLPISERAFGSESLFINYTIIVGHAPFCYLVGITLIEFMKAGKTSFFFGLRSSLSAIFYNNLTIGILLGIGFNILKFEFSVNTKELLRLGTVWIIPVSLFTMGGVLYFYRITNSYKITFTIIIISLFLQPAVVYTLGVYIWNIDLSYLRNAVIMAAMAPGLNAYFFANMYDNCRATVATTICLSTALTIFSSSFWIYILS